MSFEMTNISWRDKAWVPRPVNNSNQAAHDRRYLLGEIARLKAQMETERKAVDAVLRESGQLANIAFNLKQSAKVLTEEERKRMGETQEAFDKQRTAYHELRSKNTQEERC